ncbi:MAG: RNA-binding protein [Candidatus Riflebacteria bacterium RBG_13_59_9]|nr:MAG: RNA-binding protein [Candidatus Riflebacteria bacterium RBG_13_59_9]
MNIYVGNLSYDCLDEDLKQAFSAHGQVDDVRVISDKFTGKSKGFAFVDMPNDGEAQAAITALNGQELKGRQLRVNEARPKPERESRGGRDRGGQSGPRW